MTDGLYLVSATGNRFALRDAFSGAPLADPAALARSLGQRAELGLDGVLELFPPSAGGDCRMVVHNMDGSRAEACGNGLRCVATHVVLRAYGPGPRMIVETDAGPRPVEVFGLCDRRARARAGMGHVRIDRLAESLVVPDALGGRVEAALVDVGNPHCVLFVDDVNHAPVAQLGDWLEHHERFPARTNVEFVETIDGERLRLRVWERGVGETRSCGTGVTAAALVAVARGVASFPVRVDTAGGTLVVFQERGEVFLEGEVELESRRFLRVAPSWFEGGPPREEQEEESPRVQDVGL